MPNVVLLRVFLARLKVVVPVPPWQTFAKARSAAQLDQLRRELGAVVTRGDQPFVTPPDEGPTSNCDDISFGASASVMSLAVPQASGRWSFSHRLAVLGALAQLPSALIKQVGSAGGEDPATSIARIHQSAARKSGTCLFPNRE